MKNVHLLATNEPSRLFIDNDDKKLRLYKKPMVSEYAQNQHLYITNNEVIKFQDYFYDGDGEICKYTEDYAVNPNDFPNNKKIILTTDTDLIADGIQAIEDEFLEWFVNNPSCEEMKVRKIGEEWIYNAEIPKEEPYERTTQSISLSEVDKEQPKQETTLEDKLQSLVFEWQKRQLHFQDVAEDNINHEHTNRKFTYKAMAIRDCWKELLTLLNENKNE